MNDVSATGLALVVQASKTFPSGIFITQFADDADPLDLPAVDIAQTGMDINGNLVSWSTPTPQTVTINVLAGSEEDQNLAILLEANTAKKAAVMPVTLSLWWPLTVTAPPLPPVTAKLPTAAGGTLRPVPGVLNPNSTPLYSRILTPRVIVNHRRACPAFFTEKHAD